MASLAVLKHKCEALLFERGVKWDIAVAAIKEIRNACV